SERDTEPSPRFAIALPLQIAQHHRKAVLLRETIHLLVEDHREIAPRYFRGWIIRRFHTLESGGIVRRDLASEVGPGMEPDTTGHAIQPAGDRLAPADATGFPSQREEGGLEGVLGVMGVVEHASAHAEYHALMAPDQQLEGGFIPLPREPLQ